MLARRRVLLAAAALAAFNVAAGAARAADEPTFTITFKDGEITPLRLEVPANTRFRLELVNEGTKPAEFESKELYKEKVLAPGTRSVMVFKTLSPGEYAFFDDFAPGAPPAVLVAR